MTTTLTAQQLHELVNGEFVMPDGSKRRGLWERVPETQVSGLDWDDSMKRWTTDLPVYMEGVDMSCIIDVFVAALIRVAIEDWLKKQKDEGGTPLTLSLWEGVTYKGQYAAQAELVKDHGSYDHSQQYMGSGPTIHHALVTAAHAVADALGVPR